MWFLRLRCLGRTAFPGVVVAALLASASVFGQLGGGPAGPRLPTAPPTAEAEKPAQPATPAPPGSIQAKVHLLAWPAPQSGGSFSADEMLFASDMGLYVMCGVKPEDPGRWFTPYRGDQGGGMRRGNALKTAVADVPLAGETVPQLPWPEDIPSYYLEEQAPNLFRRVELADRPGYVVTLRRTAGAPDKVEVLLVQQSFVPTGYNETMQSYIGRPMLLKTVRTATAPLKPGMATVLLWTELRPASGSREAAERLRGTWTFVVEGNEREGSVSQAGLAWPIPYAQAPNELLQVPLDGQGGVAGEFTAPDGRRWRVTGKLNDDGTGAGTLAPQDGGPAVPWSANRRPAATGGTGGRGGSGGFGGGGFGGRGYGGGGFGGGLGGEANDGVAAVALVLTAPPDLTALAAVEALEPAAGGPIRQVEIAAQLCTLDRDSEEWKSIAAADDAGGKLAELIAKGKVKLLLQPRITIRDGERGAIQQGTELPYLIPDPQTGKPTQQKLDLPFELALTPQVLGEGQLRLTVECRVSTLAGWAAPGPLEKEVPIVAHQTITAHIPTRDGQSTILRLGSLSPSPALLGRTEGARSETGQETLLLLTATELKDLGATPVSPR